MEPQPPAPVTQFGSLMGPQRTSLGIIIAINRSAKALQHVPESEQARPLPLLLIIGIASCAIGAGFTWMYFSQQGPSAVTSQRNDPTTIPAATPEPLATILKPAPTPMPVAAPIAEPSLTPIRVPNSGELRTYM